MQPETTEYNGKIYRRYPESKRTSDRLYFKRSVTGGTIFLHRQAWIDKHGEIPEGFHIHHIDGNTRNNDVSNLECISPTEHSAKHPFNEERLISQAKHLSRIRHLTKEWHSSDEGIQKHREVGGLAYKNFNPTPKPCTQCGIVFTLRHWGAGINIVQTNANQKQDGKAGLIMKRAFAYAVRLFRLTNILGQKPVPDRVLTVTSAGMARKVYDLTVENHPEYFANGILVHNCRYAVEGIRHAVPDYVGKVVQSYGDRTIGL
jgi:hypothetical protein